MDIFAVGAVLDTLQNKNINYFTMGSNVYIQICNLHSFEEIFGNIIERAYVKMPIHEARIRSDEIIKFITNYTINTSSTVVYNL